MKNTLFLLPFFLFVMSCSAPSSPAEETTATAEVSAAQPRLRHVVLFSFKPEATPDDIARVEAAFAALPAKIPQIKSFEWGLNNSPEGLNKGFTHCFTLTFDSEEDRAVYLPHPDHKAFGEVAGPHIGDVLVVDYWTSGR